RSEGAHRRPPVPVRQRREVHGGDIRAAADVTGTVRRTYDRGAADRSLSLGRSHRRRTRRPPISRLIRLLTYTTHNNSRTQPRRRWRPQITTRQPTAPAAEGISTVIALPARRCPFGRSDSLHLTSKL